MSRKFKNITSLLLLVVFLLPTLVKLGHEYKLITNDLKNEMHNHALQNKCPICNFEFSIFISNSEFIPLQYHNFLDSYFNNYNSRYNSNLSQFTLLLRAPPVFKFEMMNPCKT